MGYAIVVDVSVARAAGETQDIVAQKCRDVLDCIHAHDHKFAMSKPLQDEWFKSRSGHGEPYAQYASMYALTWFVRMRSERRITWIEVGEQEEIANQIISCVKQQDQEQIQKDIHLVTTALASDRRVISCDDTIRTHFHNIGSTLKVLCAILWLNPVNMPASQWLCADAPEDTNYLLCQ